MKLIWHRIILIVIVLSEAFLIIFFGYMAYTYIQRQKNILGSATTIVPIDKETLIFPPDAELKNFYEPSPNNTEREKPEWLPYTAVYTINHDTLNETTDHSIDKPKQTYRIITLGDSFTFGQYVQTADNWSEKLELLLNQDSPCASNSSDIKSFEVINMGMKGYDVIFSAYRYKVRGQKYRPDLILWLINDHNLYNIPELFKPEFDNALENISKDEREEITKKNGFGQIWVNASDKVSKKFSLQSRTAQEEAALYDFAHAYQGRVALFGNYMTSDHMAILKKFQTQRKLTYVDDRFIDIFTETMKPSHVLPDGHPNALGHIAYADHIYNFLKKNNIISCRENQ